MFTDCSVERHTHVILSELATEVGGGGGGRILIAHICVTSRRLPVAGNLIDEAVVFLHTVII